MFCGHRYIDNEQLMGSYKRRSESAYHFIVTLDDKRTQWSIAMTMPNYNNAIPLL